MAMIGDFIYIYIYVGPQIGTGPVLELVCPVLELERALSHAGTVPIWGAQYWNWVQDRGGARMGHPVLELCAQYWNWSAML
jgi:hypothetical protein